MSAATSGAAVPHIAALMWATTGDTARLMPTINRLRLREETQQDVIDDRIVLLLQRGVRDAGHHGELLVRVRQLFEEFYEVLEAGDAVELAAHDDGRRVDP